MQSSTYSGWWYGPADALGGLWWTIVVALLAGATLCVLVARRRHVLARAAAARVQCHTCGSAVAPGTVVCPRCRSTEIGKERTRAAGSGAPLWLAMVLAALGGLGAAAGFGSWPLALAVLVALLGAASALAMRRTGVAAARG